MMLIIAQVTKKFYTEHDCKSSGWVGSCEHNKGENSSFCLCFLPATNATTDNPLVMVVVRWLLVEVITVQNSSSRLV